MHLKQDYQFRTIWDVIGRVRGSENPDEWVVAGNAPRCLGVRAVDPNSGTAAMLGSVHGLGELLKSGWRPKRTIILGSWDGEEEGLIGSTEWGEQHESDLAGAVAYFNMDVAVSEKIRRRFRAQPETISARRGQSGSVPQRWNCLRQSGKAKPTRDRVCPSPTEAIGDSRRIPAARSKGDVPVGDLGSGSDYTVSSHTSAYPPPM